jgi:DNA polymerase-1
MSDTSLEKPALIIDGANLFVRSYCAFPQMSSHGYSVGGVVGFMKKMRYLTELLQPRAVYVVWESGGSPNRRRLYADYKKHRRPAKMNRFYEDDIPDTDENQAHQMTVLVELLKSTPVCQLYVPDCEADDVVAWLCTVKFKDSNKTIVSSDKDMYQLLDEKTNMYSLHKKALINMEDVFAETHIVPWNFALAKALCGDVSDNIPGVKGMGFKTAVKRIPILATHKDIILQDIFDYCSVHADENVILRRVIEEQSQVKLNWKLVHLGSSSLSSTQASKIDSSVDNFTPKCDRMSLMKLMIKEGISNFDVDSYLCSFVCVDGYTMGHQQ